MENTHPNPDNKPEVQKALLVGISSPSETKEHAHDLLAELVELAETYGLITLDKTTISLRKVDSATYLTKGKLQEIKEEIRRLNADTLVLDADISPGQKRNLEKELSVFVMDRTEIIIGVFSRRAKTREAKLQIELAELQYQAPRLKNLWTHLSRQVASAGGGAFLKGAGEKQIEVDRRILKNRQNVIQQQIDEIKEQRDIKRQLRQRNRTPQIALVGYTNVGKSTLLNALTGADAFVENKLFATLDTTSRQLNLPNNQSVIVVDTVGFIRNLLVAAFRSTLEEAVQADILIHVVDASHPLALEHAKEAVSVLEELGAKGKPTIVAINKTDICKDGLNIHKLRIAYPNTVEISATKKIGLNELQARVIKALSHLRKEFYLKIPQSNYALVTEIMELGEVFSKEYEEDSILIHAHIPEELSYKFTKYIVEQ
jgi:GTPase